MDGCTKKKPPERELGGFIVSKLDYLLLPTVHEAREQTQRDNTTSNQNGGHAAVGNRLDDTGEEALN